MHAAEMIFYWAKTQPQQLAFVQSDMAITYRALAAAIGAASKRIESYGLDPREPVAVAIGDQAKLLTVCLALLSKGIPCAPVSRDILPHLQVNNINNLIFSDARDVIAGGRNIRFDDSWLNSDQRFSVWRAADAVITAADMIFFTSGTTGFPKKITIPSACIMDRINLLTITGEANFARVLLIPGIASLFGFMRALLIMAAGKTVCLANTNDPLRFIDTFKVEAIVASAQQALLLAELVEQAPGHRLDSVKEIRIGAGFSSSDLVRRIQARLCRNVVTEYGSTEAGLVAFAHYSMIADIPNAVGVVVPGVNIEIVDETNTPMPMGEEGLVRGRSGIISKIAAANHPEKAANASDFWWYPGDLGRLNENGILCIGGRTDDVINSGGVKVSAVTLDEIACRYPGVKDAGICSVRGQSGIEEAWVGIVADARIDVADLKNSIEASQNYQVRVGEVLIIEKVPRNNLGKLQRHQLKALLLGIKNRALAEVADT